MARAILIMTCFAIGLAALLYPLGILSQDIATDIIIALAFICGGIECAIGRGSYLS
jgi:hypothetical protein